MATLSNLEVQIDIFNLVKSLKNILRYVYDSTTIVDSLSQVYFTKDIGNLMVKLVWPTSK